jgi:UDP-glucose 4-epimerase
MSKQTILLTGATGFLGSHLLESLLEKGHEVVILKRSTSNTWRIEHLIAQVKSYDLDKISIRDIFASHNIEIVIHLATLYKKFEESSDVAGMVDSNISFPSELLVEAVKSGVKGFINTGTFFEYDCSVQPVGEGSSVQAFNFYAKTKLAFESILKTYSNQLCINTFKLFSPFGEKDNPKLVPLIIKSALNDEHLTLSEGLQKLDFIYVKDIVDAYLQSIERMLQVSFQPEFEVFNLGSGFPLSVRDIVSIIEKSLDCRIDVAWGQASERDVAVIYADIEKAKRLLNWTPINGVKKGILNSIEYYKAREKHENY